MVKAQSLFANLYLRLSPKSLNDSITRTRNLCIDQVNPNALKAAHNNKIPDVDCSDDQIFMIDEIRGTFNALPPTHTDSDEFVDRDKLFHAREIAKEVSVIIRTRPRWEQNLTSIFPDVNFVDPGLYYEILKQQNNVFLSLRFFVWIKTLNGFSLDLGLCTLMFCRLVEAKAAKGAQWFLDETKFEPKPEIMESYIMCLCENGYVDQALIVFGRLKVLDYCASLQTWNSALLHSLKTKRVDIFWAVYEYMTEFGVPPDVDTVGYLTLAFCMDKKVRKGYMILRQTLEAGLVPSKIVFNKVISEFCKIGDYDNMSAVLHNMIENNCPPDIFTYQEVIHGLHKGNKTDEGFRVFNDLKDRGYFPDTVMYSTIIRHLFYKKKLGEAQNVWFEMIQKGISPNKSTYSTFIDVLWMTGQIAEAEKIFKEMHSKGYGKSTNHYNSLINCKCVNSEVKKAWALYKMGKYRNTIINGMCLKRNVKKILVLFPKEKKGDNHNARTRRSGMNKSDTGKGGTYNTQAGKFSDKNNTGSASANETVFSQDGQYSDKTNTGNDSGNATVISLFSGKDNTGNASTN